PRRGLQWSHAQLSVETLYERVSLVCGNPALQWSHAQLSVETWQEALASVLRDLASMEPRSVERGNSVEELREHIEEQMLQWSHAQLSVETLKRPAPIGRRRHRFNGATLS